MLKIWLYIVYFHGVLEDVSTFTQKNSQLCLGNLSILNMKLYRRDYLQPEVACYKLISDDCTYIWKDQIKNSGDDT